jgi:ADP-ribose pyrophosphatase
MPDDSPQAPQTETVESSETIYEGKVVTLRIDTVRFPNGKTGKREVIEHSGAVTVVPLLDDGETVVLVRQWRLPAGKSLLEIPAGGIEKGEDPEAAAARELAEEIGKKPGKLTKLFTCYLAPGYSTELMYGYLAEGLTDHVLEQDEDENVQVVTMKLSEALDAVTRGEIEDSKTLVGLTLAARALGKG